MAIYHFKSQIIKRSAGRSATSAAAYRARTTIRDDRTGLIFDYRHIKSASHCQILAPQNVPEWVYQRSALWNEVEKAEKRKDSQLAREIMVALPSELSRIEQIKLGAMFVHKTYVSKGMIADLAFHDLDTHNPHMHVMLTMRTIDSNGFGKKERSWNPQFKRGQANGDFLKEERQLWQDYVNLALKRAGHRVKVDCRSLADRGSNQVPQIHLGARANALEKIGIRTAYGDEHRRIALVNQEIVQLQLQKERISQEIEAEKKERENKLLKQQQELKRQREHSQKTANQPQRNQTPEERLMIQTDKESRKQGFSDRGIDFDIQTDQSPAKSEKNWRAQQENQPDNLFDRKGFEQSESGIRLTPEKPDNSPDLNPENPPLQQELKQGQGNSQKTVELPQKNYALEELLRMIQAHKRSRKKDYPKRGFGFEKKPDNSPDKSDKNSPSQRENQTDNLFDRKGFGQSDTEARSTPEKPDNSPDLNPENPPLQQDNIGEKDDATSYNKRLIGKYFEAREKLKSSDTTQPENTSQTSKKPDHPAPDPQESEASPSLLTSPDNIENACKLLRLGVQIYKQTPSTQAEFIQPNVWEIRGYNYTLRFNSHQEVFSISKRNVGLILDADLKNKTNNELRISSIISQENINAFERHLKHLKELDEYREQQRQQELNQRQQELKPQKSQDIEL